MSLFGTWHRRILEGDSSPGTRKGRERLGCPAAGMGTITPWVRSKPAALPSTCGTGQVFGHPAETNLGLATGLPETRIGTCSSKPTPALAGGAREIHVPNS